MEEFKEQQITAETWNLALKKGVVSNINLLTPTQEQLHAWIRKNHNKEVMVKSWIEGQNVVFLFSVNVLGKPSAYKNRNNFSKYEDAYEAGLVDALNSI